jgi:hypothetical protein
MVGSVTLVTHDGEGELALITDVDDGTASVQFLGDRRMPKADVPVVGDICPNPMCDGVVEDWGKLGRLFCSEGCLEWLSGYKDDGQDCDKYASHDCDGHIVHETDADAPQYRYHCTDCDRWGAGVKSWREAWWPGEKEKAVDAMRDRAEEHA